MIELKGEKQAEIVSYEDAINISSILGKCTIKSLGSELFVPIIKLKANLSSAVKKYYELQSDIHKSLGLIQLENGGLTIADRESKVDKNELFIKANEAFKQLNSSDCEVTIDKVKLITEKNLESLHDENRLTTGELEILLKLVK